MRDRIRTFGLVLGTAFRADPLETIGAILLEGSRSVIFLLFGVWLKLITDGVLNQDPVTVIVGMAGLGVGPALGTLGMGFGTRMRLTLMERAGFAFERRYAQVASSLRGLAHHEHPEFRDKLELLQRNQWILAMATNALVLTLTVAIQAVATLVVVATLHPLLLLLPLFGIPSVLVSGVAERWSKAAEEAAAPLLRRARHLHELGADPGAGKEIRVFGLASEVRRLHDETWLEAHRISAPVRWRVASLQTAAFLAFAAGFVGAVVFVAVRAARGLATPGDVVLAVTVAGQVNLVLSSAIGQLAWMRQSLRNADRFSWLLDHAEHDRDVGPQLDAPSHLHDGVRFEDVSFRYPGTDRDVLKGVSLQLPAGSVVALVGENGAGKSTLVKILCGFYQPTEGHILVDGAPLGDIKVDAWRERTAGGFQDFARLEFIIRESVGVGDLPHINDAPAVVGALRRSGGEDVLEAMPNGIGTQLGRTWEGGIEPSTGQWQKLALGRALMRERPLLTVLDEPTASLDAETEHALFERYGEAARLRRQDGAITLLVSHRFSTVRSADIIVVIDGGRIIEQGSHDELISRNGIYAELFNIQARGYR